MERSREFRRSNLSTSNGLSRRRQRIISFRDSHDEDSAQMQLQDTARLRDRVNKRDRNRDGYRDGEFSNHKIQNKNRRGDGFSQENNREGEDESTEESIADEEEYVIQERRATHASPHNSTSFPSSSFNQNTRKSLPPTKLVKQTLPLKAVDEIIGVSVPRKRRSASTKRPRENWVPLYGGFEEDHKAFASPAVSRSANGNSPSFSSISVRKKLKSSGPKTRLPKGPKSSSSTQQDDIEIEIAEVLFGLMQQSHNPKKEADNIRNTEENAKSEGVNCISQDNKSSVSVLSRSNSPSLDLLHGGDSGAVASKKKKDDAGDCSNAVQKNSVFSESELSAKREISTVSMEKTMDSREEVTKQIDSKSLNEESGCLDGPVVGKSSVSHSAGEESTICTKMNAEFKDLTVTQGTSNALESGDREEEKFKIDLMAPPPMVLSPERDGINEFTKDPKPEPQEANLKSLVKDEGRSETLVQKDKPAEELEQKKAELTGEKQENKFDLEKQNEDSGGDGTTKLPLQRPKQQQQQEALATIPKGEKAAQSSSMPAQATVAGWPNDLPAPNGLPALGYMHPLQTVVPVDGSSRTAASQQPPQFMLSQPKPKRCATHHYIARNILLHQQFTKMNPICSAGLKTNTLDVSHSNENLINGNPLPGSFQLVNVNSVHYKGRSGTDFSGSTQKDKASDGTNLTDLALRKQVVLQQASQPTPAGSLPQTPASIFPFCRQQAAMNQSGPSKSAASTKSASVSGNSNATLPVGAAAVSYSCPNFAANEAPYLSGYPFSVSAPVGNPAATQGGPPHTQALPLFNGSFYSSPIFHPSQLQQQQHQHHQNTNISSVSSSSCKQPQGSSIFGNNFLSSTNMQSQQHKPNVPSSKAELNGENASFAANSKGSHNQTSVYGQNFSVPVQPLSLTQIPSGEKQQQSQNKSSKGGGVGLTPSQAFAMSCASFNGSNVVSNLNFSSMTQTPTIFQSVPEVSRQNYQFTLAAQPAHPKNHQTPPETKTGGGSLTQDDGKKAGLEKSPSTNVQTLVFDNSSRTLSFVSSCPVTGNWPTRSVSSIAITTNTPPIANSQSFQQEQLLQFQKQQNLQQQKLCASGSRSRVPTTNSLPSSSIASRFPNNATHIFPQAVVQGNTSSQSSQWKNSTRTLTSQAPTTTPNTSSTLKNVSHPQQISFERNSKSAQILTSSRSPSPLIVGSPPSGGGNLRTCSTGNKAGGGALQSQQTDNSSASTTGQKSSPVCGRNVPSILRTCTGHLSELKY